MDFIQIASIGVSVIIAAAGMYVANGYRRQDKKENVSPFGRTVSNIE